MYFSVDYDKLSKTGRSLSSKTHELESLYFDIYKLCQQVGDNWMGEDSTIYLGRMEKFLESRIDRGDSLYSCSNALNKISFIYNVQDNKWANDLLKSDLMKKRADIK